MILIDTHILLEIAGVGDKQLGPETIRFLEDHRDDLAWSSMSAWETAMLADKQRIILSLPIAEWTKRIVTRAALTTIPVSVEIAVEAGSLPSPIHGDPGDRILIATARVLGLRLVTADRKILDYAAAGHLQAIDARR